MEEKLENFMQKKNPLEIKPRTENVRSPRRSEDMLTTVNFYFENKQKGLDLKTNENTNNANNLIATYKALGLQSKDKVTLPILSNSKPKNSLSLGDFSIRK